MTTVGSIINEHGLGIDMHPENLPNNGKLALYEALIHCNIC